MRNVLIAWVGSAALLVGAVAFLSPADARQVGGARAVGGAPYLTSCAYQYGRWQATGSTYWHDLYYLCTKASDAADEALD